jgi:tRNA pseudouridine13 synthase
LPRLRAQIDDFEVEEVPLYLPCGEGEHTFLWVEKRGVDTEAVTRDLARALRLERLAIGYAGRKDRWAVTRQWISVPRLPPAAARELAGPSWRVLDAVSHRHKLRTGDLLGNRFRVVVRGLTPAAASSAVERLAEMTRRGMSNRFGRQRFGRDGDNAAAGAAVLRGERFRGDRRQARFLVSALQSALFNQVLERRPAPPWQLLDGDLAVVHRSGGLFAVPDAAAEAARAATLEISPTGPIYGAKMRSAAGAVAELEEQVWRELGLGSWRDLSPPRGLTVDGARRALRVPVGDASARGVAADRTGATGNAAVAGEALELRFELPAGSYATVLVEELFPGTEVDEGPPDREAGAAGAAASEVAD